MGRQTDGQSDYYGAPAITGALINMKALAPADQKLLTRLKFLKSRSNSKVKGSRSWYQMKGLTMRNAHMKYETPNTYQSKVITKVKVLLTDGRTTDKRRSE
jgi:hypothetical protein